MVKTYILLANLLTLWFLSCTSDLGNKDNVFSADYIRKTSLKVALWQLDHPQYSDTDWTNAVFYSGVFSTWEMTQDSVLYNALIAMGDNSTKWKPGPRSFHADDMAISQTYIDLYRVEQRDEMLRPSIDSIKQFIDNPYPVKDWQVIKWWWCDALFMGPPTMVKLGVTLNEKKYLEYSDLYFKECYNLLYDKDKRLFSRALNYVVKGQEDDKFEANGSPIFWSRGNGWVMAGLARILSELPEDYPQREFYTQLFREMVTSITRLQPEDGLWRTSLLDPDSYPHGEVSGSSLFCYALAWGINEGVIDKETYLPVVEKVWMALNKCIKPNGSIGWVQPIGANPDGRFNENNWEVFGTGSFLLAANEMIKLAEIGLLDKKGI